MISINRRITFSCLVNRKGFKVTEDFFKVTPINEALQMTYNELIILKRSQNVFSVCLASF